MEKLSQDNPSEIEGPKDREQAAMDAYKKLNRDAIESIMSKLQDGEQVPDEFKNTKVEQYFTQILSERQTENIPQNVATEVASVEKEPELEKKKPSVEDLRNRAVAGLIGINLDKPRSVEPVELNDNAFSQKSELESSVEKNEKDKKGLFTRLKQLGEDFRNFFRRNREEKIIEIDNLRGEQLTSYTNNNGEVIYIDPKTGKESYWDKNAKFRSPEAEARWNKLSPEEQDEYYNMTPEEEAHWQQTMEETERKNRRRKKIIYGIRAASVLLGVVGGLAIFDHVTGDGEAVPLSEGGFDPHLDSDGNGIPDWLEAPGVGMFTANGSSGESFQVFDIDGDGIPDVNINGIPLTPMHLDGVLVFDLDGDGTPDISHDGYQIISFESGGTTNYFIDEDGDGIPDRTLDGSRIALIDFDGDGTPDYLDIDGDGIPDFDMHGNPISLEQYMQMKAETLAEIGNEEYKYYSEGGYKTEEDSFYNGDKVSASCWGRPLEGGTPEEKFNDLLTRYSNSPSQAIDAAKEMHYDGLPDWVKTVGDVNEFADQLKADPEAYDQFMNDFLNWMHNEVGSVGVEAITGPYASTYAYVDGSGSVRLGYDHYVNHGGNKLQLFRGIDDDGDGIIDRYEIMFEARIECGGNNPDEITRITVEVPKSPEKPDTPDPDPDPEQGPDPDPDPVGKGQIPGGDNFGGSGESWGGGVDLTNENDDKMLTGRNENINQDNYVDGSNGNTPSVGSPNRELDIDTGGAAQPERPSLPSDGGMHTETHTDGNGSTITDTIDSNTGRITDTTVEANRPDITDTDTSYVDPSTSPDAIGGATGPSAGETAQDNANSNANNTNNSFTGDGLNNLQLP